MKLLFPSCSPVGVKGRRAAVERRIFVEAVLARDTLVIAAAFGKERCEVTESICTAASISVGL
ncbi:MAG: hypothetical protein ACLRSW_11675 [Christensenellaceae bacterium]